MFLLNFFSSSYCQGLRLKPSLQEANYVEKGGKGGIFIIKIVIYNSRQVCYYTNPKVLGMTVSNKPHNLGVSKGP